MANKVGGDLAREAGTWVEEGIVSSDAARRIVARYPAGTRLAPPGAAGSGGTGFAGGDSVAGTGWATQLLYTLAGVLIAGAVLAFIFAGIEPEDPVWYVYVGGLGLAAAALGVHFGADGRALLGDALLLAGFILLVVATFPEEHLLIGLTSTLGTLGTVYWRRDRAVMQSLAIVGFTFAFAATFFDRILENQPLVWIGAQTLLLAGIVALERLDGDDSRVLPGFVAVLAFTAAWIYFLLESLRFENSEVAELILGGVMIAVIAIGIALRQKGMVTGGVLVLSGDAIVFAFDVGGAVTGTVTLLLLAGVFIWQAETLKGFFTD